MQNSSPHIFSDEKVYHCSIPIFFCETSTNVTVGNIETQNREPIKDGYKLFNCIDNFNQNHSREEMIEYPLYENLQ